MKSQPMPGCVINEWDDRYSSVEGTITNGGGSDIVIPAGEIVNDDGGGAYSRQTDDLGTTGGVLKADVGIPAGESKLVAVLVRGPSIVNGGALSSLGGTLATSIADLEGLGIVVAPQPDKIEPSA